MNRKSITSYDVAAAAGVSQSAVSRAFSPTGSVAEKKRQHILKIAREMGYRPNAIARSMSSARSEGRQKSGIVGVIASRIQDPFFANIMAYFSTLFQSRGWHLLLFTVDSPDEVDDALHSLMSFKIDGVVILSAILSDHMAETCRANGTPVVLYNRRSPGGSTNSVQIDNRAGGRKAAEVLLNAGRRRIAFVGGPKNDHTSAAREKGFSEQVAKAGLAVVRREYGDYTFKSGCRAAARLFAMADRPDAVFCASDVMALGVLHAARHEHGLDAPGDFSLIGFDDIPSAAWPGHRLTSIRQPVRRMIAEAVDILIRQIEDPEMESTTVTFSGDLRTRATVGRRAGTDPAAGG